MADDGAPNWLRVALGNESEPQPPDIRSDRIKDLLRQAMLEPSRMRVSDVQELAASVLRHLVATKA